MSVPAAPRPSPPAPRPAATILLVRDEPAFQVLLVRRHHEIDFAGGAYVFPGGKLHAGDEDPAWADRVEAIDSADPRSLRVAAIREAFEEAGVLLARHADGRPFAGAPAAEAARADIAADRAPFLGLVASLGVRLDLASLSVFARWITPAFMPKRFDTWFYLARAPLEALATCDGRETVDAEWIAPAEALRLADRGERTIIFPTRMNLKLLAQSGDGAAAVAAARARSLVTVEPRLADGPEGRALVIPPNAGYGAVREPLVRALGG